jgi:parallel beta-helix repeat protein
MKKPLLLIFIFLLFSTALLVDSVNPAATEGNMIYIRPDGSVEPATAPIQRDGNVYTLTDNIHGSIFVEKDDVVIDGDGFILQGTGAVDNRPAIPEGDIFHPEQSIEISRKYDAAVLPESNNTGIYSYAQKLTIMNLKITEFWCAIELESSSDNCIIDNEIASNTQGVWIHSPSSNNTISRNNIRNNNKGLTLIAAHNSIYANNITDNSGYSIKLSWSFNTISGNRIKNSRYGVIFEQSTHNVFRNNSFNENDHLFYLSGSSVQEYFQDVDSSNNANGRPIYYWINQQDLTVPTDAAWVALVNCTRIRVENLNLTFGQQITLISTTNSTVTKNVMAHNQMCIYLRESSNNTISKNTITNSDYTIQLVHSSNNYLMYNNLTDNTKGIDLGSSSNNAILQNHITKSDYGIKLLKSNSNIISGNNLVANVQGIHLDREIDISTSDPYNSTVVYGCCGNTFLGNNISENDCGALMESASNNTFSGNNFVNNANQTEMEDLVDLSHVAYPNETILDFPSVNFWDNGTEGNYWSNYTGVDSNGDGIGDTSHVIDKNNQDNYPLMNPNIIPESPEPDFSDDKNPTEATQYLIIVAVVVVLAIIFGVAIYRQKRNALNKHRSNNSFILYLD